MKTVKILIRPIATRINNMRFIAAYSVDGRIRAWLEDDTIKEFGAQDKLPPTKKIIFDKNKGAYSLSYQINENTDEKNRQERSEQQEKMRKLYTNFLCNHPTCLINGERHLNTGSNPLFNVVDVGLEFREKYDKYLNMIEAANLLNDMPETTREEVMYYYGDTPVGKDKLELLLHLGNFTNGLCILDAKNFLDKWRDDNDERTTIVTLRKAIDLKIIEERRTGEGTGFYVGNNFVGIDFSGIRDFMQKKPQIYQDHVLRLIKEQTPKETKIAEGNEVAKVWTKDEIKELRDEAKVLSKEGFIDDTVKHWIITVEKLYPIIEQARKRKEAESKNMQLV